VYFNTHASPKYRKMGTLFDSYPTRGDNHVKIVGRAKAIITVALACTPKELIDKSIKNPERNAKSNNKVLGNDTGNTKIKPTYKYGAI
jgi:hypothetical protein